MRIKVPQGLSRVATRHPLFFYFLLAYVFGWLAFLPLAIGDAGLRWIHLNLPLEFGGVGACAPLLAALCTQKLAYGDFRICRIFSSWKRTLLGLLLGFGLTVVSVVILPVVTLVQGSPRALHWSALVTPSVWALNWSTILGGPINEEPGWRGFALPRLQVRYGPLIGTLFLGLLWGCWHLPLFLVQGWTNIPALGYLVLLVSLSVLMTLATNVSRFSIIVPMVMHAVFNTSARLLTAMTEGIETKEPWLLYYIGSSWVVAIGTILLTRGKLAYDRSAELIPQQHS